MNLLTIEQISKSFTERMLFDRISFGINEGDKIGVIGINGTGKSTLLKIVAGLEDADEGTVTKGNALRIAYLPQTPVFDTDKTILENVTAGQTAKESYRNLTGEARAMLLRFGIENPDGSALLLSGGQKKRAALVRTLLTESDLLVLDEPTNHLDAEMTEWLEDYLHKWRGAFLMVTHDRYFLDRVTNKIIELDKGKLYQYQTNYSGFVALKAEREEMALATERKAKALFKTELAWMQRGARARSTKQKAHIERFEALRDREKPAEDGTVEINALSSRLGKKTVELGNIAKSYGTRTLFSNFSYILLSGDRIGIVGKNGCGKSTLLNILTGKIQPDEGTVDIGVTVKLGYFSQENEALNPKLTVLEYIRDTAEYIETSEGTMTASAMCERFLFDGSMQHTKIEKLSGGEKRRLYLLKVLMEAPNLLVLDEPTNDLDITTLTILENYLASYAGIIVTVSHDRYFLDKLVTRIFAFENGEIVQYEGNYSDYKAASAKKTQAPAQPGKNSRTNTGTKTAATDYGIDRSANRDIDRNKNHGVDRSTDHSANHGIDRGTDRSANHGSDRNINCGSDRVTDTSTRRTPSSSKPREQKLRFTYNEQREYETIDADIAALEEKLSDINRDITAHASEYSKLQTLLAEKEAAEAALEQKMERWVYLNDLAEQIKAQKKQ